MRKLVKTVLLIFGIVLLIGITLKGKIEREHQDRINLDVGLFLK